MSLIAAGGPMDKAGDVVGYGIVVGLLAWMTWSFIA
jgi:hypothetical protein